MNICIAAYGFHTRKYTPFDDPRWEIWGLNSKVHLYKREDLHFEVHACQYYKKSDKWRPYYDWLRDNQNKVMLQRPDPDLPEARILDCSYPYDITSSVMWMMLHALTYRSLERILLTGVELATASEYSTQRRGVFNLMEDARAKGVEVWVPKRTQLFEGLKKKHILKPIAEHFDEVVHAPNFERENTGYVYGLK